MNMDKESFFFGIFLIWYLSHNDPEVFLQLIVRIYYRLKNLVKYYYTLTIKNIENNLKVEEVVINTDLKPHIKYEDKYLNEIRKLDKEFKFDETEKELQNQKTQEFMSEILEKYKNTINELEYEISAVEIYYHDKEELSEEKNKILDHLNTNTTLKKAEERSRNYVIDKRLEKLKNCYVIEQTPLGNVMMIYDKEKNSFKYYSDNTIPYRYLEPVARKYVKLFNCRPIFVDMEEELKIAEEKWDRELKELKEKEANNETNEKGVNNETNEKGVEQKKNVFAKFKSYNKEAGSGRVNVAPPPKNSIPNRNLTEVQENEKILLKEKANRYVYEGKFANFSFIKKIDRKVVDKKFSMTFADFKKNILQKQNE